MSQEKNTAGRSPKGYPNRGVCVRIEGVKNNPKTRNQCTVYERNGQLVFALNSEIMLPENAPVRLTSAQLVFEGTGAVPSIGAVPPPLDG